MLDPELENLRDQIDEAAGMRHMTRAQFFGFYAFGLDGASAGEQASKEVCDPHSDRNSRDSVPSRLWDL
ncbi:hypothetical protein [Robbsia sp. KACC 23696]|uniref:hypothetical protein n=1 Tax=Robbsia sp. KACC 23696 TaxID=3149231 RepID=UPI00325BE41D